MVTYQQNNNFISSWTTLMFWYFQHYQVAHSSCHKSFCTELFPSISVKSFSSKLSLMFLVTRSLRNLKSVSILMLSKFSVIIIKLLLNHHRASALVEIKRSPLIFPDIAYFLVLVFGNQNCTAYSIIYIIIIM